MTTTATCRECGQEQSLSFTPDSGQAVYCQRCGAELKGPEPGAGHHVRSLHLDAEAAASPGGTGTPAAIANQATRTTPATPKPPAAKAAGAGNKAPIIVKGGGEVRPGAGLLPADSGAQRLPPHDGLADYKLDQILGRGGMGIVYQAFDDHLQRNVALKMMNPQEQLGPEELETAALRFEQEALVTGKLQHPGIVPVYVLDTSVDGTPFYTMRPIEGRSLRDILTALHDEDAQTVSEFPLIRLIRVLAEACRAVAYAHDQQVIHRDLKPGNIMVGKYGEVLVIDWGLAKCLDIGPEHLGSGQRKAIVEAEARGEEPPALLPPDSNDGYIIGTPAFMPPEQTFGAEHITTRSDVYSLGTILYQILTLTAPFDPSQSLEDLLDAIRYEAVDPPSKRAPERNPDPELSRIALRCLNKLPQDRPETAAAVVRELDHWLEGRPQFEPVYECHEFTEREVRTRWFVARGDWECIDGSLQPLRADGQNNHYLLMFREALPNDLRITVKGTLLDDASRPAGTGGSFGLVAHSPTFKGHASYLVDGYIAEAPAMVEGAPACKLVRNDVDIAYGDWPFGRETTNFECCLEVLNAHYTLTVNGQEVLSHTEFVQLPGAFVGFYTFGPAVLIHSIKIESAGMQERVSSLRVAKDLVQSGHPDVAVEMLNGLCTHFAGRELSAKAAFQAALIKIDLGETGELEYFKRFIQETVYAPFADLVDFQLALNRDNLEQQADALMRSLHRSGAKLARQVALQEACAWEHGHRRLHREVYHRSFVLLAMLERQEWDAESRDRIRDRLIECYTQLDQRLALPYLRELAARPGARRTKEKREELSRAEIAAMTLSSWVDAVPTEELWMNLARTQHLIYHQVLTLPLVGKTDKIKEYLARAPMPQPSVPARAGMEYFRFASLGWWREIEALEEQGYNFNTTNASQMAKLVYDGDLEAMAEIAADGIDLRLLTLLGFGDRVKRRLKPIDNRLQALQASHHLAEVPSVLPALGRADQARQLWEFHAGCYGRGTTWQIARILLGWDRLEVYKDWFWRMDALSFGLFLGELGFALQLGGREAEALEVYEALVNSRLSQLTPYTWQQQWARRTLAQAGRAPEPLPEPERVDLPPENFAKQYLKHLGI